MHVREMRDSEGDFSEWAPSASSCKQCGSDRVSYRSWDSHCGGYTDLQYRCDSCGRQWWIEGPDA
jgi:DNA-directed RNA polymerase subunit M/transcription elongation factor TFIIS